MLQETPINPPGSDTTTPHSSAPFRSFVETQIQLVDEDDQDKLQWTTVDGRIQWASWAHKTDESYWSDLYARIAKPSYDEELALYELLELDADGENDIELEVLHRIFSVASNINGRRWS